MTGKERSLYDALDEMNHAMQALMRALVVEDEATVSRIMDRIPSSFNGFGQRANTALARARGKA